MRAVLRQLLLAVALAVAGIAALPPVAGAQDQATAEIDYAEWASVAASAEEIVEAGRASTQALEDLRARIVVWRTTFDAGRGANGAQVETLKNQIAALGAAPADGAAEAPEIAQRRRELNDLLARAQAPSLAAIEAFSRADGIIKRIDALIRERQADALLRLLPSPANPLHWPSGVAVLTQGARTLSAEVASAWENPARRTQLRNNMPLIVVLCVASVLLMLRGSGFMERLSFRLQTRTTMSARHIVAGLVSLGQIGVPVGGMALLQVAILSSGIPGPRLTALVSALTPASLSFFAASWLASYLFPDTDRGYGQSPTDRPAEARFHVRMLGLMVALEQFRTAFTTEVRPPLSQAAQALWLTPNVLIIAVFLFRLGMLLRRAKQDGAQPAGEEVLFRNRLVSATGTIVAIIALVAPALALIGYVAAANALIWPTVRTLALAGLVILLQHFLTDIYITVTKSGSEGRERLIPVLTGFLLTICALPLVVLAWGARPADLSEAWTRFRAGVELGGTRISPTAILTLLVVFALGYMATKIVQGAIRASVLPRTKLDKGAQNAVVSGLGYVGLFLSGLIAVTAAGIDLSALAIVAGALSVGIGFGLQNIVQNFISGIILLIERPISEGDVIQVGNQTGTVRGIFVRSTWIETEDRSDVIVPNANLISGIVTNLSRRNPKGQLSIPVMVSHGSDARRVHDILTEIAEAHPLVQVDPAPRVDLVSLGPDGLKFEVVATLSDMDFKPDVQTAILHAILEKFVAEGIEIPLPQQDVWLRSDVRVRRAADVTPLEDMAQETAPRVPQAVPAPVAIHNDPNEDEPDPERR